MHSLNLFYVIATGYFKIISHNIIFIIKQISYIDTNHFQKIATDDRFLGRAKTVLRETDFNNIICRYNRYMYTPLYCGAVFFNCRIIYIIVVLYLTTLNKPCRDTVSAIRINYINLFFHILYFIKRLNFIFFNHCF